METIKKGVSGENFNHLQLYRELLFQNKFIFSN